MAKQEAPKAHPWLEAAMEWGKRNGSFCSIEYGSPEYEAWGNYFIAIGYMPALFAAMNSKDRTWTAPTRWPDAFDMPLPELRRREVYWRQRNPGLVSVAPPRPGGWRANLFVGHDKPGYAAMCERAKTADPLDWCWYRDHPKWGSGIKVPIDWYQALRGGCGTKQWRQPTDAERREAQAVLDRAAAEAAHQRPANELGEGFHGEAAE